MDAFKLHRQVIAKIFLVSPDCQKLSSPGWHSLKSFFYIKNPRPLFAVMSWLGFAERHVR